MDYGMRVVLRGKHETFADGRVSHELHGPSSALREAAAFTTSTSWCQPVIHALSNCPLGTSSAARLKWESSMAAAAGAARVRTLYSWIIAPKSALGVRA